MTFVYRERPGRRKVTYRRGQVVKLKTCKLCGMRRVCRIDEAGEYTGTTSKHLIAVCLSSCSRFRIPQGKGSANGQGKGSANGV